MKSTSSLWQSPNADATNSCGFTGLPGGLRQHTDGTFSSIGIYGDWWSATEKDTDHAYDRELYSGNGILYLGTNEDKKNGYSVRCVRDQELIIKKNFVSSCLRVKLRIRN